ncbi:1-aminocyclopropane-1-carboxylate synthase-like protein 2 [Myotis brandtii]|uniref:1-aminocyclopropane-1-carboxylate synthase-like protein 2 n=1 Tax=Myotis brandtii TaxID=109478 RepID=S7N6P9_MYOBR|nr:1-aminocyclopropane-1-carboxylate synthase-like protein 2 [Myotis brandtii]
MRGQGLRNLSPHTHLMELIWRLQQTTEDYIMQLETRHLQQDLVLEKQRHSQATREQEAILTTVFNLLHSGATSSLELQMLFPPPFLWTLGVM